jgi:DHA1 family bicyclomycin/chloramphenicol resistance-like MFS transporter
VPLFFLIGVFPFVNQNASAVAQGFDLQRTGAVSSILGAMSVLSGAALAAASGLLNDGTPRPMAITIVCTTAAALVLRLTGRKPPH